MPSANQSFKAKALLDKNRDSKSPPSVFFISISTNEWGPESFYSSPGCGPQSTGICILLCISIPFYFKVNEINTSELMFFCLRENQEGMT